MQNENWYAPLRALASLGSQKEKISNMGQLAEARAKHLGQFFTPDAIARFMWNLVAHLPVRDIMDNSIGSARLLQFADPERHRLYGVDVHQDTVDRVKDVVQAAGFECEIICAGMEAIKPKWMDLALINPPFSIHLESPSLQPFEGFTRMGRFGPDSSSTSDEYAVAQALKAAPVVVALLPRSSATAIAEASGCWKSEAVQERLRAIFDLPNDSFKEEGASVQTSVVVFGSKAVKASGVVRRSVVSLSDAVPELALLPADYSKASAPRIGYQLLESANPTIVLPVTGDPTVRISVDGRKVKLRYHCGLVQAKVANGLLVKRIYSTETHRLPSGVRFEGQGKFDIEAYLMQDDPVGAFNAFMDSIRALGGTPLLAPGVIEMIERKRRRNARSVMPLKHTIWTRCASSMSSLEGVARKTHNVDPEKWLSPTIKEGESVQFERGADGRFVYERRGSRYEITADELEARFVVQGADEGWQVVHTGLLAAYPEEAERLRKRAISLGIGSWLTWDFQMDDLVELTMKPTGAVAAWKQACGKSRLAAALVLLSGAKHGLIVVESRLIDEMLDQLRRTGVELDKVCVIDSPAKLETLGQINLIAYERLRMPVNEKMSKRLTYAHKLRRRIGILIADEGERLANFDSDQSRALFQVSARKRYILTGTPIANYPRDIHGLLLFTSGDGTAAQPYGLRNGYMEKWWIEGMQQAERGIDRLKENFVTVEWVTHAFSETLRDGAKREIPKLANVEEFRKWLAPHVKRRLTEEPEVAKHIQLPKATFETVNVEWDSAHLAYYLKAADDFAQWYRDRSADKKHNLAILLAKLQAVSIALNIPQNGIEGMAPYVAMTSKQRAVLDYLRKNAADGKKSLLYCENPGTVNLLHAELAKVGISSVRFHGGISIGKRVAAKNDDFVNGSAQALLATKGSAKSGYNLPGSDVVLFYDRSWSAKVEGQAMARPMRVERDKPVHVVYFHLPGSLDIYQDQMVAFKKDSADAGLDWASPQLDGEEFLHLSTILNSFVDDLAKLHNTTSHKMRERLKKAA